jgi:hypothetical protein
MWLITASRDLKKNKDWSFPFYRKTYLTDPILRSPIAGIGILVVFYVFPDGYRGHRWPVESYHQEGNPESFREKGWKSIRYETIRLYKRILPL